MKAVYKRELQAYFTSPVAYCVIGFFLAIVGFYFLNVNLSNDKTAEFTSTISQFSFLLVFFAPVITMRLLSDEKKNGTEVLLRTSPVKMWKIVLGKYFASFTLFLILVACTLICPIIIYFNLSDGSTFPWSVTIGGYIGFIMLGAAYLAIGMLASSLTESQTISAVLGVVILLILLFLQGIGTWIGGKFGEILVWISLSSRYADFATGLFNLTSIIYYLSFTVVVLFVTIMNMERKRWS